LQITFFLFFIWFCFLIIISTHFKKLKSEISFLKQSPLIFTDPAVGYNINHIISLPNQIKNIPGLLIFSMSKCPHCHSQIENWIEINLSGKIPTLLVVMEDTNEAEMVKKYNSILTVQTISFEKIANLEINKFPTFLIINEQAEIITVMPGAKFAYDSYMSLFNEFNTSQTA
jgi:glutaredoxin